jgi:hypothetical protein
MRNRTSITIVVAVSLGLTLTQATVPALQSVESRQISETVRLPANIPLQGAIKFISMTAHIPAGFEFIGRPTTLEGGYSAEKMDFTGLTVADAVSMAIGHDPRYAARFLDGVLVVRPLDAWNHESDALLDRRVSSFAVTNGTLSDVLEALREAVRGAAAPLPPLPPKLQLPPTPSITVNLKSTTVLGVLNAVARAHGSLMWEVWQSDFTGNRSTRYVVSLDTAEGKEATSSIDIEGK